ncbi:DUF3630 family protein [Shewanella gelidii]|uniref:DUF3630 domain-containing protein n=1 Tax=Shewanella gelidii TaxID=1642821 RepID=A0A917JPX2_9GAMM|nr:DUF3630 family protein [Shewanella gelidii]MCL1097564.1 DUF3630 family protein [Shewanella gelidii]GGI80607.1 DUF3630 domain-containing protein [Shewanella gelidii]
MNPLNTIKSVQFDADNKSLQVRAAIEFDHFDAFALPLVQALDCQVLEQQWGADRHQWRLDFESCVVWLNYEFYGDVCWLAVEREQDIEVLSFLQTLLLPFVKQEGELG